MTYRRKKGKPRNKRENLARKEVYMESKVIRISGDVLAEINRRKRPLCKDTPNAILRRVLGLPPRKKKENNE